MKTGIVMIAAAGLVALTAGCYSDSNNGGSVVLSEASIESTCCSGTNMGNRTSLTITNNGDRVIELLRITVEAVADPDGGVHETSGSLDIEAGLTVQPGAELSLRCGNGVVFESCNALFSVEFWLVEYAAELTLYYRFQGETTERRVSTDAAVRADQAFDSCGYFNFPSFDCRS